jgi:hypothetical protein
MKKSFYKDPERAVCLVFLLALLLHNCMGFAAESVAKGSLQIQTYTNSETAYTVYGFRVETNGVQIEWRVVDRTGNPKKYLWLHSPYSASFMTNLPVHKAIMAKIFATWPVQEFGGFSCGRLGGPPDWSWSIAIAIASSKSADYQDYRLNYPNSRIKNVNSLFKKLAVESDAYRPLQEVFKEFGTMIKLESVEKVVGARAEDLPFYPQLRAAGISGKTRVLYDAMGNGFTLKPQQAAPASKR